MRNPVENEGVFNFQLFDTGFLFACLFDFLITPIIFLGSSKDLAFGTFVMDPLICAEMNEGASTNYIFFFLGYKECLVCDHLLQ